MNDQDKQVLKQEKAKMRRSLFIQVLLMFLVSIVVFVIGTYYFVVPRMITQSRELAHLRAKVTDVQQTLNEVIAQVVPEDQAKPDTAEEKPPPAEEKTP
jgi:hypothetical protein